MANLPYEILSGALNLRKAPKRKLPCIEDNGKIIADSSFILNYPNDTDGDNLDAGLSKVDKAVAHAFIEMIPNFIRHYEKNPNHFIHGRLSLRSII